MAINMQSLHANMDEATDLRRRRTREIAEIVVDHAGELMPDDRAVLHAIYRDGMSARDVADLRSEPPRRLRQRVRRLVERVLSDRFLFVLRYRDQWPTRRRRIAKACVLEGRSMRDGAAHLQMSLHTVRREMLVIDALFREASRPTPHHLAR